MRQGAARRLSLVLGALCLGVGIAALRQGLATLAEAAVSRRAAPTATPGPAGPMAEPQRPARALGPQRNEDITAVIAGAPEQRTGGDIVGREPEAGDESPGDTRTAIEPPDRADALRFAVLGQRLLVRDAREDPSNLLSGAQVTRVGAREGAKGLAVAEIADGSRLAGAELEDGDRIVRVNGVDARGLLGQRAALREIASSERWLLEVEGRRGPRSVEIVGPDADRIRSADLTKERFVSDLFE